VNPTQFGPNEDFSRYPRPLANDLALLNEANVDAAWLPTVSEMYPEGCITRVHVPRISQGLEGALRPGHFDGVATVVAKLLLQVQPHIALFGEKDYQQLCLITRMVADLNIPTHIMGVATEREADGLALSSRNQYLTHEQRAIAPVLYAQLQGVAKQLVIPAQAAIQSLLDAAKATILAAGFERVDYFELRDAMTLEPLSRSDRPARLLVAALLGTTRLLDNISIAPVDFS
jgi:pantoate--beta-alanine ligase